MGSLCRRFEKKWFFHLDLQPYINTMLGCVHTSFTVFNFLYCPTVFPINLIYSVPKDCADVLQTKVLACFQTKLSRTYS
jgi:hypothetical protein